MYRTYDELLKMPTFEERFEYLKINGKASEVTFADNRFLNQMLYRGSIWKAIRKKVIIRDRGCDLGIEDRPICPLDTYDRRIDKRKRSNDILIVHHLNPLTVEQVLNFDPCCFDLNNLICCSRTTHNAIHYGDLSLTIPSQIVERRPGDTKLW